MEIAFITVPSSPARPTDCRCRRSCCDDRGSV